MNPQKTTCMLITTNSKRKTLGNNELKLHIDITYLQNVKNHKLLGVLIDDDLSWKSHSTHVLKKLNTNFFIFQKIKIYLSRQEKILFHNAYPTSHRLLQ